MRLIISIVVAVIAAILSVFITAKMGLSNACQFYTPFYVGPCTAIILLAVWKK